jgi:hypothetical protein
MSNVASLTSRHGTPWARVIAGGVEVDESYVGGRMPEKGVTGRQNRSSRIEQTRLNR